MYDANPKDYDCQALLGICYNGVGTIHLAVHKSTDTPVVIKKFFIDNKAHDEYSLVEREILITRQLQHPNVLPYVATFVSGLSICAVSPLMGYGSCRDLITEYFVEGLPEFAIAFIVRDVLQGLRYIHSRGYIHRAVKASHILVSLPGRVCLTGMRYACEIVKNGRWQKHIFSFPKSTANNLSWLSPELLQQDVRGYNEKSDTYSLGMTICELANGVVPFYNVPKTLMLTEKLRSDSTQIIDRTTFQPFAMNTESGINFGDNNGGRSSSKYQRGSSSHKFSENLQSLTLLCLQQDPSNRPTMDQLLSHPFLKQCRKSNGSLADILKPVEPINYRNLNSISNTYEV